MRKLATIRKISSIDPIPGADAIEVATVDGWKVVVKKGEYSPGDLAIYCEIDSFLPIKPEYEFLRKSSYKKMGDQEGFRLRTVKLRGQISQGLLLPLSILNSVYENEEMVIGFSEQPWSKQLQFGPYDDALVIKPGVEVTDLLDIVKYDPPIPAELAGVIKGPFPYFVSKTDEERIQNLSEDFKTWSEEEVLFEVTEKLDGSSATFYVKDGIFGVCSRNWELSESETNTFWKVARELDLERKMKSLPHSPNGFVLQGELIGEGVQGNPYKIKGHTVRFYNAIEVETGVRYHHAALQLLCKKLDLECVPLLEITALPKTIDELLLKADGKSILNQNFDREGLVFRNYQKGISFKVISNLFLEKEK